MKVSLANPGKYALDGSKYPPLGLLYLVSTMHKNGYQEEVMDSVVEGDEVILEYLGTSKPDIVGITCLNNLSQWVLHSEQPDFHEDHSGF